MEEQKKLAQEIVTLLGEKENILKTANCMTRLRVTVKDVTLVQEKKLKELKGVLGLVQDGNALQVVLGPGKAQKITDICIQELGLPKGASVTEDWQVNKENLQKSNPFKKALRTIAEIFIPLIPAIIAAGLFNGFGSLLSQLLKDQVISGNFFQGLQLFFSLMGSGFLAYFAIYTGIGAAKVFGANEALGGMIGAISIGANIKELSQLLGLYNQEIPLESILTTGKGGIIGVIVGVYLLAKIEKKIRSIVPDALDLILTPALSLLTTSLLFVFFIMPLAGVFSDGLVSVLSLLVNSGNAVVSVISGFVLSALFLPMVLLGLHHGLIPIYAVQLEQMGGVSLFPVLAMAGAGQVGAAIAIYIMAKKAGHTRLQQIITGALPAGFLGVGEPLIYGVTLPMFKPFITAGLGAGFGGAYVMFSHVMSNAWGPSGLVAIPLMQPGTILNYIIGLLISYAGGFIITYLFVQKKDMEHV